MIRSSLSLRMPRAALSAALVAAFLVGAGATTARAAAASDGDTATGDSSALRLERGSIARRQLVALGQDLIVEGEARENVATIGGSAVISGTVGGDVLVLGGDARLTGSAQVDGDLFVFGGRAELSPGARLEGRSVAYPGAPSSWLLLIEGPALGLPATSPIVLAAKAGLLAAWLIVAIALCATFPRALEQTADRVRVDPLQSFVVGLVAVLSIFLTLLFISAFTSALVGAPLLALAVVFGMVLKLWGTVALFLGLGSALGRRGGPAPASWTRSPMGAVSLGVLVLGTIKFLPWLGVAVWTAITLLGMGATLTSKFGREEQWVT